MSWFACRIFFVCFQGDRGGGGDDPQRLREKITQTNVLLPCVYSWRSSCCRSSWGTSKNCQPPYYSFYPDLVSNRGLFVVFFFCLFYFFLPKVAVQFADLHDTPGRMEARGAVRKVVPWSESRSFFFWRLRRRLAEFDLQKQVGYELELAVKHSGVSLLRAGRRFLLADRESMPLRKSDCSRPEPALRVGFRGLLESIARF